jgi:hypothetical protein
MLSRRSMLSTSMAAMLAGHTAEARLAGWQRFFKPPAPQPNLRVVNLPATASRISILDGQGDEDLLLVLPETAYPGRVNAAGFHAYYIIGGLIDPAGDGWMYAPNGTLVWGIGDVFKLQTARYAISRPFYYISRLRFRPTHTVFGDFFRAGGAATTDEWEMWPDITRYKILADAVYGWGGGNRNWGEPPAPAYHGDTSHSDFLKLDCGGFRHALTGAVQCAWGFQQEFMRPSWATTPIQYKEYRGPDGRGMRHFWDYVAVPQRRADLGTGLNVCFWGADGDPMVLNGQYSPMSSTKALSMGAACGSNPRRAN